MKKKEKESKKNVSKVKKETSKKKDRKTLYILLLIVIVAILITIYIIFNVRKESNQRTTNISIINYNYSNLTIEIKSYNEIREKYNEYSKTFYYDTYLDNKEKYQELLSEYNKVISEIDNTASSLKSMCNLIYKDKKINTICSSYGKTYEKIVNLYIIDLKNYNKYIEEYNKTVENEEPLFDILHTEYIDYNNDKIYEGATNE